MWLAQDHQASFHGTVSQILIWCFNYYHAGKSAPTVLKIANSLLLTLMEYLNYLLAHTAGSTLYFIRLPAQWKQQSPYAEDILLGGATAFISVAREIDCGGIIDSSGLWKSLSQFLVPQLWLFMRQTNMLPVTYQELITAVHSKRCSFNWFLCGSSDLV